MLAGRLLCSKGYHSISHCKAHTTAKEECFTEAGIDVSLLVETGTRFTTTLTRVVLATAGANVLGSLERYLGEASVV